MSVFPIVTICGSMRYYNKMLKLAAELTNQGYIVLMPFISDYTGNKPSDQRKELLDRMHLAKIDMSTAIYVVGTHIGESTTKEIAYARQHGKLVY